MTLEIAAIAEGSECIPLDELKLHLRVDHDADDATIHDMLAAAREYAERMTNISTMTRQHEWYVDAWPLSGCFWLPRLPVTAVTSISYYAVDDTETTLSSAVYQAFTQGGRILRHAGQSWPTTTLRPAGGIKITFTAGHATATDVPQLMKSAIKLIVGDLYENRENTIVAQGISVTEAPIGAKNILHNLRKAIPRERR